MNVYLNQGTRIITFIVTIYFMHSNVFFKNFFLMCEQTICGIWLYDVVAVHSLSIFDLYLQG